MTHIVFFDGPEHNTLLPLTYLKPIGLCQLGSGTIQSRWCDLLNTDSYGFLTKGYLSALYQSKPSPTSKIYINGACLPSAQLAKSILRLGENVALYTGDDLVAYKSTSNYSHYDDLIEKSCKAKKVEVKGLLIRFPEHLLDTSQKTIEEDFQEKYKGLYSSAPSIDCKVIGNDLYIGKDAKMTDCTLNTSTGPIIIEDGVEIMEGSNLRGPIYIGPKSVISMGAKIYGNTIIGSCCRVGGEVKRSTIGDYSNKSHDGYLGDSLIGKWCNLGANTINSNMKNSYGKVSLYQITDQKYRTTERNFLGVILGDHTMTAINTSFNTGSVTGIFCNILDRSPPRYISSFSWGSESYIIDKAVEIAGRAMKRQKISMGVEYEKVVRYLASQ